MAQKFEQIVRYDIFHAIIIFPRAARKLHSNYLLVQLSKEKKFIASIIITLVFFLLICLMSISGDIRNASADSFYTQLNHNSCQQANECIPFLQIAETNDLDSINRKTDFKNIIEHQIEFIQDIREVYGKSSLSRFFIILFMTLGPIKIIPVFVRLTQNATNKIKNKLAIRSFALSTSVIFFVALTSQNILDKYNISLSSLIAAAGIILFLISIKMLLAQYDNRNNNPIPIPENPLTALISPLTFPTILTPQGIALVMIAMTIAHKLDNNVEHILGLILIVMLLNLICMLYAKQILNVLRPTFLQVMGLMLTIIQLALAISFIFAAINLQILTIYYILEQ